jgi:hypothetical protein
MYKHIIYKHTRRSCPLGVGGASVRGRARFDPRARALPGHRLPGCTTGRGLAAQRRRAALRRAGRGAAFGRGEGGLSRRAAGGGARLGPRVRAFPPAEDTQRRCGGGRGVVAQAGGSWEGMMCSPTAPAENRAPSPQPSTELFSSAILSHIRHDPRAQHTCAF